MESSPRILIIAGPNGAGKTTFAQEFLPREANCPVFVNADLIAAGLSPFEPGVAGFRAGRLMLEEISRHAANRESFAFETTLAGQGYARLIRAWQISGYRVKIIYLRLDSPEQAIARVAERVRQGGHNVPEPVIRRRFHWGLENFNKIYAPLVNAWVLYDNSGNEPVLLDWSSRDE
ncbi:MAG: zeta toxin family protein [Acidobacteriota bacterium]|nr:zeta toxin family protein [Acidobacteriota bacterium]